MDRSDTVVSDLDSRFDDDYMYFFDKIFTPDFNDREAELASRLLSFSPGMEILDAPCGYGRIANRLAAKGARVTGLDASTHFLNRARHDASKLGVEVDYVAGDMRQLPWTNRFDGIISWFISFGYFDDTTNRQMLAEYRRALRPGGRLIIDHGNLAHSLRDLPDASRPRTGLSYQSGNEMVVFNSRYVVESGRVEIERIDSRDGTIHRHSYSTRFFTFTELRDWLLQAGFSQVEGSAKAGGPLTIDSPGMVIVAIA